MAPEELDSMGTSLPNFVSENSRVPLNESYEKPDEYKGSVFLYPTPTAKGLFLKDNYFDEVLQAVKRSHCSEQQAVGTRQTLADSHDVADIDKVIEETDKYYVSSMYFTRLVKL